MILERILHWYLMRREWLMAAESPLDGAFIENLASKE